MALVIFILHTFIGVTAIYASSCQFPADLRGVWISSDKGFLRFGDSVIYDYPVVLPAVSSLDLHCVQTNGTHYLLKSPQDVDVFSIKVSMYVCLSFDRVSLDNYMYYVATPLEKTVNENIYALSDQRNASMEDVCNIPNTIDNMYSLIKNVTTEDIVSVDCPSILKNSYASLFADENGTENPCTDGYVSGCVSNTEVVISTSSSCQSNTYIPDVLRMHCLFHKTVRGVTYLYTWTDDVFSASPISHGFICIEISQDESSTTFELFNDTCSDVSNTSEFLILKSKQINETCLPTTPAPPPHRETGHTRPPKTKKQSTNWAIYFAIVVFVIIIIGFIVIIIKFFRKEMCDLFKKKPSTQQTQEVSFTNIAANSTDTLDTDT